MLNIPDKESVLSELSNLFPIVHSALNYAIFKTSEFFEQQEADQYKIINRYLAPNLVRFYAIQALYNDNDGRFNVVTVPNNGLYLVSNNYSIRILKSCNGQPPVPGHSIARQRYYQQLPQLTFEFIEHPDKVDDNVNLLILWEVTPTYNLRRLSLACPKSGELKRDSVTTFWHCLILDLLLRNHDESILLTLEIEDLPLTFSVDEETEENMEVI
jgi:hypothetical protein